MDVLQYIDAQLTAAQHELTALLGRQASAFHDMHRTAAETSTPRLPRTLLSPDLTRGEALIQYIQMLRDLRGTLGSIKDEP